MFGHWLPVLIAQLGYLERGRQAAISDQYNVSIDIGARK